jgi:hypothetical protein
MLTDPKDHADRVTRIVAIAMEAPDRASQLTVLTHAMAHLLRTVNVPGAWAFGSRHPHRQAGVRGVCGTG